MSTEARHARESEAYAYALKNAAEERVKKLEAVVRAADRMEAGGMFQFDRETDRLRADYRAARAELGEIGSGE